MKNLIIVTLAVVGLSACSSNPTQTEYRNPSSLGESFAGSSQFASDLSGTVIQAAVTVSDTTSQASVSGARGSSAGSKSISAGLSDILSGAANSAKDVAIIGWGISRDSSAIVISSAKEASQLLKSSARHVITTSGSIFEGSVNSSRTAIGVSVELAKDSGEAIVKSGGFIIGAVKVSADVISDAALWTSETSSRLANWSLNTSGELVSASGRVLGNVVDSSGRVISIVVDKSGKILVVTSDASVAVIHSSGDSLKRLASDVRDVLKSSGDFISGTVQVSAQKTLIILKWSAKGVSRTSKFISNSIKDLFYSAPETRDGSAASGSGSSY